MAYRLGILFSFVLLGIVMLYLRKKEMWAWDKIVTLFTITVLGVSILGGTGIFLYIKMFDKPDVQTSFWGIDLSSSKTSITFIKGPPDKITPEKVWVYRSEIFDAHEAYYLSFNQDQLRLVGYMGSDSSEGPSIQGIERGSSLHDVIKRFGQPSSVSTSADKRYKLYSYENYNVFFVVKNNSVSTFGVYNPQHGPIKIEKLLDIRESPQ